MAMSVEHFMIVGGTTGIGRAMVRRLSERGARVSVFGRHRSPEIEGNAPGVSYHETDLTDVPKTLEAVDRCVQQTGKLSHLVFFQRFRGKTDSWEGEIKVSLTATKLIIERFAESCDRAGNNSIVIVSSIASRLILAEQPVSYHMAKAALTQMARYYAVTLGSRGIRVNSVSPDACIKDEARKFFEENRPLVSLNESIIPLGRMGRSEDVVNVIEFVCSPMAGFMTGQDLVVDGGLSIVGHGALARRVGQLDGIKITRS